MNIGDYVRTKNGMIAKIINQLEVGGGLHTEEYVFKLDNGNRLAIHSCKVVKSSPNIIDLIEVGDYVNGMKITNIWIDKETNNIEFEFNKKESYLYVKEWDYESRITKYKLKSIVTHEQFSQMEYKL